MNRNYTPQLEDILRNNRQSGSKKNRMDDSMNLPCADTVGSDGVDHINIYSKAKTDLGLALALSCPLSFRHSVFGKFKSVESFWFYLRTTERDDRIRTMSGGSLRKFAGKLKQQRVVNFCAIFMDANWQKVKQFPEIENEMRDSVLPFEMYYTYRRVNGVRIRPTYAHWMISGFEEIRKALKENREPDFRWLMDNKNIGLLDSVLPKHGRPEKVRQPKPAVVDVAESESV